jgi:hypothetical protein
MKIDVLLPGATDITQMDDSSLHCVKTSSENDREIIRATEYYYNGHLVHRSAHVHLKEGMFCVGAQAEFR